MICILYLDIPTIISGEKIVYLDPQEKVWPNRPGRSFTLSQLLQKHPDALAPFNNVAGFSPGTRYYPKTLFRFPLRTTPSELSDVVYTLDRIDELIEALRGEANLLLPFLRSVNTIEVHKISSHSIFSMTFRVEIAASCRSSLQSKRQGFLEQLKAAHSRYSYGISSIIDFDADFTVNVTDNNMPARSNSTDFLVVATVGSNSQAICDAAKKQKVFPWVGTAIPLVSTVSNNGRIFCFLPMPVDAASNLPVHVNGTFGLNDDRRSMKWPGSERRNDPTANWNNLLVSHLLPPCYVKLLLRARNHKSIAPKLFYQLWPEVNILKGTHWEKILVPVLKEFFQHPVFWSERTEALRQVGEWVAHNVAVLTPSMEKLPSVVCRTLSTCGVKLVTIPQRTRLALNAANIVAAEVTPRLARSKLRSNVHSYISIDPIGKRELLRYCLKDKQYNDLREVVLLPLANSNFIQFQQRSPFSGKVYICNSACPHHLLPNKVDHILVDVSDDQSLQSDLHAVAASNCTQLALLTVQDVAQYLPQCMPTSWQRCSVATLNNPEFPSSWFETFWNWIQDKQLSIFEGHFVLPVGNNDVVRLNKSQAVVYIPQYSSCSSNLLSAFNKLGVKYTLQSRYPYLKHRSLANYVNSFNTEGVLDSIYTASHCGSVTLTDTEAQALLSLLAQNMSRLTTNHKAVLKQLAIFKTSSNSSCRLYSPYTAAANSLLGKAVVEPPNLAGIVSKLPSNIILFSRSDYDQTKLLGCISTENPTEPGFILQHIFPLISGMRIGDHFIDSIMSEIRQICPFLNSKDWNFSSSLSTLAFVPNGSGYRKSPESLFDSSDSTLKKLYKGENVFPTEPYNNVQWLQFLKQYCSLRTSVKPDEILTIISSIKAGANNYPQHVSETRLTRAKAVLQYISTYTFQRQATGTYYTSEYRCSLKFSVALNHLANNFSWLPVLTQRPSRYPTALPWKGEGLSSHFFTQNSRGAVMKSDNKDSLPYIVGSQVFLTDPADTSSTQLSTNTSLCEHVIAHLKLVISQCHKIPAGDLSFIMDKVYSFLNAQSVSSLNSIKKWIYIPKKQVFVSPSVVAINPNSSFRQNLEPYLYILPESLLLYLSLFTNSGVSQTATPSQIIAVLGNIKESIENGDQSLKSVDVWSIVMSILNWLTDNGTKKVEVSTGDCLYVPTESQSEWPQLMLGSDVVYTDNEFLKNFLSASSSDESYTFVHSRINPQMANCLGITPLSDYLDITEDTFEDTGQYEPLTVRLKNILRDYKDGLTIAKELLQNADDAEATEVNFCYDARTHTVDANKLFFPEMLSTHGPALLVHNNKTFSNEDFDNITKLAGATKHNKPLKIGKFGIGFCSVYHITDVPSFISGDTLTIFDPTMNFLKKEIKNPSRPGKKVKFTSPFIMRSKQLAPYNSLFGLDPQNKYNGTLFRLPFRNAASELSGTCYTESGHIQSLIAEMTASSSHLILFLQNVKKITFQVIKEGDCQPSVVLQISKSVSSIPSPIGVDIKDISCKSSNSPAISSHWVVSNHSTSLNGKQATAAVAASLEVSTSGTYTVDSAKEGQLFCFLPLSQKTGLPVHVSGNFAVINNRRGIWTSDDSTYSLSDEVQWNVSLMESVIPTAYHQLLVAMINMQCSSTIHEYSFYSLWPLDECLKLKNPWSIMIKKLYEMVSSSALFYSDNKKTWLHLNESKFLSFDIFHNSSMDTDITDSKNEGILEVLKHLQLPMVHLPLCYRANFNLCDHTITEDVFLKLFFENLDNLSKIGQVRDKIILLMLEVYASEYDDGTPRSYTFQRYFENYACIPCAPDGSVLKKCKELIDPHSPFANLYDEEEHWFPIESLTKRLLACSSLNDLGMISETLPYQFVVERAHTIENLYAIDKCKALRRTKLILNTIELHMEDSRVGVSVTLDSIPFLPVLSKPSDYPLPWAGEGHQLMKGNLLMVHAVSRKYTTENNGNIAGTQVVFVDEKSKGGCGELSKNLQQVLGIRISPSCKEVVDHLRTLINFYKCDTATECLKGSVNLMCRQIYRYLDEKKSDEDIKTIQELSKEQCIWTGKRFLFVQQIAINWKLDGPYLHKVPSLLSTRQSLCKILSVKDEFGLNEVENALTQMKADFGDKSVDEKSQLVLRDLVSFLLRIKPEEFSDFTILLPDNNYILRWSKDLAYNDAPWAPIDETYRYVNDIIPRRTALLLNVRPVRGKLLDQYVNLNSNFSGVEFGQREELTRRIQNILRDYPFDVTLLKELLQNADDAKATKMYVILDKRTHGKESVLSEEWQTLQGPALLVWNDSVFTEKDIKGIQELGLGSKRSEAESIGQYGIGFNSVYHLTDCPSFISNGDTLCVLDPHCTFVPGATPMKPGRRYDNLKSGFWDKFKDIKAAYLRSNISEIPSELLGGSMFRFPLRNTISAVKKSKIVSDLPDDSLVDGIKMQDYLKQWAPKMRDAMFFLNNVREICFFIIEKDARLNNVNHYHIEIDPSDQERCTLLHQQLSVFNKKKGCKPCVVRYPITRSDVYHDKSREWKYQEKWIVQQGIGDINKQSQSWSFVERIKPRHGIAALIGSGNDPKSTIVNPSLNGQVFCFLPLPIRSSLPVHVNGHFILNSTRRQLWQTTNPGEEDGRSLWNKNLLSAIASSYTNLLENVPWYLVASEYKDLSMLHRDIEKFYLMFPEAKAEKLEGRWLELANECYEKMCKSNCNVLSVVERTKPHQLSEGGESKLSVRWHPIKSLSPSSQVHFWSEQSEQKEIFQPILEAIGMTITVAPFNLRQYINNAIEEKGKMCPEITPQSVYEYYIQFYNKITSSQFPCDICSTSLQSVTNFKLFTSFVLQKSAVSNSESKEFPSLPFGYPLLLTADGNLRMFDQRNRVLMSQFADLFPQSTAYFLHSSLLDMNYTTTYFVTENCDSRATVIHKILSENLPQNLCDVHKCCDARSIYPTQKLQKLWFCLSIDPVFKSSLTSILKRWALIVTTDNRLYSMSSQLHPIIPPSDDDIDNIRCFQLLARIGMPVVDTSIVMNTKEINCPVMSNHTDVLNSLFHLAQETNLSENISKSDIKVLIVYLSSINYRTSPKSCQQVKSLPIFENVVGDFVSLSGIRVFTWPNKCTCFVAYNKWIRNSSVVFLKRHSDWKQLCSQDELGIQEIETEDMYVNYIFPHFHLMLESERYEHLRYIRDNIYYMNKLNCVPRKHLSVADQQRASKFINDLKNLQCIGKDGHPLQKVNSFCDHDRKIFTTFSIHFQFLPDYFTSKPHESKQWMNFFRELGLKNTIDHEEFITFCTETAQGKVSDVRKASSVLVESLFSSEEKWHLQPGFLQRVSKIRFLCAEKLPSLSWIVPPVQTPHRIQHAASGDFIDMTEPSNTALLEDSTTLWTMKPIVELPRIENLLSILLVCRKPSTSDVIKNLCNICQQCKFADANLFEKFPGHLYPPTHGRSVCSVVLDHFNFLQNEILSRNDYHILKSLKCIPVYAVPDSKSTLDSNMVLVSPRSVIISPSAVEYHPFLHKLPAKFNSLTHFLGQIGVNNEPGLEHMQTVLESIYEHCDGKEIDPNVKQCVEKAVKFIYKTLNKEENKTMTDVTKEQLLSPLYLPGKNGMLALSNQLLYYDQPHFFGKRLDLKQTEYVELDISHVHYDFYQSQFCTLLPASIRPKGTSELCTVKLANECIRCDSFELSQKLSTALEMSILSKAVVIAVKHKALNKKSNEDIQPQVDYFLKGIEVVPYKNLQIMIMLKSSNAVIGKVKLPYYFEKNESDSECTTLYLDMTISKDRSSVHYMFSELAELLCSYLQHCCKSVLPHSVQTFFKHLFMAESANDVMRELQRMYLPISDVATDENVTFSVGSEIPQEWHYRLDQDVDNLFHANEFVGYEDDDGRIIVVKIVHLISTNGDNEGSQYTRRYLILTTKDDETGKEVDVLSLYKFTKGVKRKPMRQSRELVPYEGEVNTDSPRNYDDSDLKSVKVQLCKQLREIWNLDEVSKKKAIRRLFLKWHPDRNPDNPDFAEKIFKFLLAQIQRLERGLSLDDPDTEHSSSSTCSSWDRSSTWSDSFRQWSNTAQQHNRQRARDQERHRGNSKPPNFGGWSNSSSFTDNDYRVPKQPEEGQRWLLQAAVDRDVLFILFEQMKSCNNDKIAGHVCFMAHQLAEKTLKAGMYAICGLDEKGLKDHALTRHAYALQTEKPHETLYLAHHSASLENYYLDTRYPNRHPLSTIPADVYSSATAEEAKDHAASIYGIVESLFDTL